MKCLFYTDPHWSLNSSIVRSRGSRYSTRLENLIQSVNWVEQLAVECGCSWVVCGGDFFDSTTLGAEELSALKEIEWAPITHIFLTGNHETNVSTLDFSASDIFNLCPNAVVISKPECNVAKFTQTEFAFLPYILERDRRPIEEYFGPKTDRKRILFSHNDLKDVQYGMFLSTEGFTIEDIQKNSDLCLNGHIHHCGYVADRLINGGNLTGQNFTEDAYKFEHCVQVIDTETLHVDFYRNPFAFNFYKMDLTNCSTYDDMEIEFKKLRSNAVLTIKCQQCMSEYVQTLAHTYGVVAYRLLVEHELTSATESSHTLRSEVDHLVQFKDYVLSEIGDTNIIREELSLIMR